MSQPQLPKSSTRASPLPHLKALEPKRLRTSRRGPEKPNCGLNRVREHQGAPQDHRLRRWKLVGSISCAKPRGPAAPPPRGVAQAAGVGIRGAPLGGRGPTAGRSIAERRSTEDTAPGCSPPCALICWRSRSPRPPASQRRPTSPLPDSAAGGGAFGLGA